MSTFSDAETDGTTMSDEAAQDQVSSLHDLFLFFIENHDLVLTEDEIGDIINAVVNHLHGPASTPVGG